MNIENWLGLDKNGECFLGMINTFISAKIYDPLGKESIIAKVRKDEKNPSLLDICKQHGF